MNIKNINTKLNQSLKLPSKSIALTIGLVIAFISTSTYAQRVEDVRWKSESQVRNLYGEPNSIQGPIGTHASYTLWKYDDFTIAFANNRAFHLFDKDSLTRTVELEENRP